MKMQNKEISTCNYERKKKAVFRQVNLDRFVFVTPRQFTPIFELNRATETLEWHLIFLFIPVT